MNTLNQMADLPAAGAVGAWKVVNPLRALLNRSLLAKRFVAGQTAVEAIGVARDLNRHGISATLDFLGESVRKPEAAEQAVQQYLTVLDGIEEASLDSSVSLKLTQMGIDISRGFCLENVRRICERASSHGTFVRIDMESSNYADPTLSLFEDLSPAYKNLGVVIQAYLFRSEQDLQRLIEQRAPVRLCKGAYKESAQIAFQRISQIRRNFKKLAEMLLLHGNYPAIATHDDRLIAWTKKFVADRGISKESFEFQMLYGLRPRTTRRLAKEGYHVRVYVPYGTNWLPYFIRRLRERRENVYFVLRNLLKS